MVMNLGDPCWKPERVAEVITNVAKMDTGSVHEFLATHAPVLQILDERLNAQMSEEQLHQSLWDGSRTHSLAVVFGDPGTGKSHLIHWLKLRCAYALDSGELTNICPVLVQRRTGSLKDALSQMVEQLPVRYHPYLQPIHQAIGNISQTTARLMMAQKLALELGVLWKERGRQELPYLLKDIAELCSSKATRDWLCRDGGVIDQNVRRLTAASTVDERAALPEFSPAEFRIPQRNYYDNAPAVRGLLDELEDSPELVSQVSGYFNTVLRDALNEMSGLGGSRLRELFDQIRVELKKDGLTLALFVEDVSVMSSLDKELFHTVEPQSRADLCPLVAVLGMTESARTRLADNEKQRITHLISVGKDSLGWTSQADGLARFTARYLNAVRLSAVRTQQLAESRRQGQDVALSECMDCPVREACHQSFGKVEFDGVAVGLFPLTPVAPKRLLDALDEQKDGVRRNPRGFLDHLLRPLLKEQDFSNKEFPRSALLPIRPQPSHDWSAFESKYCGAYSHSQRARLKLLAHAWVEAESLDSLARALAPLLEPLGLPQLPLGPIALGAIPPKSKPVAPPAPAPIAPPPGTLLPVTEPPEFKDLRSNVDAWLAGTEASFKKDATAKDLLYKFLKASLPRDEVPGLPSEEFDRLLRDKGHIQIEGQSSSAVSGPQFYIRFPRDKETADLILALGRFQFLGKGSWEFENAEIHKRVVSRWLRRHGDSVMRTFHPENLDLSPPLRTAVQLLCLAAVLRRRIKLPSAPDELVREVLTPWETFPTSLSRTGSWKKLLDTLRAEHVEVRRMLLSELNVPQGTTGGITFINPLPLIQEARAWMDDPQVTSLAPAYFERFWKPRYAMLEKASLYANLGGSLEPERTSVRGALNDARSHLANVGLSTQPLGAALLHYCAQLRGLLESLKKNKMQVFDEEFEPARKEYASPEPWARALERAAEVLEQQDVAAWLTFDPTALQRAVEALARAARYVDKVEKEVTLQEVPLIVQGDPDELARALLATLTAIGGMNTVGSEAEE